MEWSVLGIVFTLLVVLLSVLEEKYGFMPQWLTFWRRRHVAPTLADTTLCLGRIFKLGMLYASHHDRPLPEKMLWNEESIRLGTKIRREQSSLFTVITDDSLFSKLRHLGVDLAESDLALSLASGFLETTNSAAGYLRDIRASERQARVTLRFNCTAWSEELSMEIRPAKLLAPDILRTDFPTHVIVGVEYGAEAFFVFDKDVPDDEDYNEICRRMESLVGKLPKIAVEGDEILSEEEQLLASQLRFTLHSDFTYFETLTTFNDAIKTCKILHPTINMETMVPKKAWIYPLHYLDKNVFSVQNIEGHCTTKAVDLLDELHHLELKIKKLMKHEICCSIEGIYAQLKKLYMLIEKRQKQLKEKVADLIPQIRQKQCNQNRLENVLDNANSIESIGISKIKQWLNEKEADIYQISEYLSLIDHASKYYCYNAYLCYLFSIILGIELLLSQDKFDTFIKSECTSSYIVCLEFNVDQRQCFDPEEICRFDSDAANKINNFTRFAHTCNESKCIVAVSCDKAPLQQGVTVQLYEPGVADPTEFQFPIPIEKPTVVSTSWNSITIKCSPVSSEQLEEPIAHAVFFRHIGHKLWHQKYFEENAAKLEIDRLDADTPYEFKIVAKYRYGFGPTSLKSEPICTDPLPLAVRISNDASLCQTYYGKASSPIKILKLKTKSLLRDDKRMIAKEEFGKPNQSNPRPTKVVMVVGATGAGKSTLINGMVNFILGVEHKNKFRFILICDESKQSQAHSQTSIITAYTLYWQEGSPVSYNLTIIDTPGFGDTRGIDQDKKIPSQVKDLFSVRGNNGIDQIHAIGFVAQSSLVRLTPTQRYVFDSILSIFGKDVQKNIFIMATFADSASPPVISAVEVAKVPHAAFFPFNNSALYQGHQGSQSHFSLMFWEMGCQSFASFFSYMIQVDAISLQLTREVLREREQLEIVLESIHPKIQAGLSKMEALQKEETVLINKDSEVLANQGFEYTIVLTKQRKKRLDPGTYVTNCLICNVTCHYPCSIPNDEDKYNCAAMNYGGPNFSKCTVCPDKCSWENHCNNQHRFEFYTEEETRKLDDLYKRYNVAVNDKNKIERIIDGLHNELADLSITVYKDVREARRCIERLGEIALKPNPMTEVEYIDLLIESEKQEKRKGYENRISAYKKMRKQAQLMNKMTDEQIDEDFNDNDKKKWWQFWC